MQIIVIPNKRQKFVNRRKKKLNYLLSNFCGERNKQIINSRLQRTSVKDGKI